MLHRLVLVALAAVVCSALGSGASAAASSEVHHVTLRRQAVPVTRVFTHLHRPWARMAMLALPQHERHMQLGHMRPRLRLGGSLNGSLPFEQLLGGITTVGEYYAELYFGGQPVRVQVDTGSSTLAVPLAACSNCRQGDQRFDLPAARGTASSIRCDSPACMRNSCGLFRECNVCSASSRACCSPSSKADCGFFLMYADNSGAEGALVEAEVSMAGFTVPLIFGGIMRQIKGFEAPEVDGILGMAYKTLACNPTCVDPLFDTLVETGKVKSDRFSLCTGKVGGTMTLGGNNPEQYVGDLRYVPMGKKNYFYDVNLGGVTVGGKALKLRNFSNGIVDSGTTLLVITTSAYLDLKRHFQTHYCHVPDLCPPDASNRWRYRQLRNLNATRRFEEDDEVVDNDTWFSPARCAPLHQRHVDMLPNITLQLDNGVELTIAPDDYMLRVEGGDGWFGPRRVYRCLGIQPLPGMDHLPNNVIIGDTVLQKYYYEIDRANNRVGFAPSRNCALSADTVAALRSQQAANADIMQASRGGAWWPTMAKLAGALGVAVVIYVALSASKRRGYAQIGGTS